MSFAAAFKDVNEQELQEEEQKIKDEPKRANVQEAEVCLFRIVSSLRFVGHHGGTVDEKMYIGCCR